MCLGLCGYAGSPLATVLFGFCSSSFWVGLFSYSTCFLECRWLGVLLLLLVSCCADVAELACCCAVGASFRCSQPGHLFLI
jgi:hypothetical protein